ncbi:efflux transporter outer membrane subunit [Geobacter sp. SVR]|uniref:efflux transporter outer membrane subunit n=1 Tax=Geobacter sp. SVR TaxID=2495594 RepID=UPI00143F043C|nr:efflux transporter outer membrane subunit [Geobacter sp. SVR]BCS55079.1 transporter [Geobacter sp. SVR]GCF85261.1 transporter [Geobacter sp. SVR]
MHLRPITAPHSFLSVLMAVLTLTLSGCMVGPDYRRPDVEVSPTWTEAGDTRVKSETGEYRTWWQAFNDPVLNQLIGRAYDGNLSLKVAGVRVIEARAQLGIAAGNFYPQTQQINGSLQHIRTSQSGVQAFPPFEFSLAQIAASASWELDFWGKFRRGIESASAAWLATAADYDNALVSLTADVATSYINVRTLEKRIEIARQNVETGRESLKIAETRFRFGVVSQLDVEQAKAALSDTMATIPALDAQLKQQRNALCVLLGMAPNDLADMIKGNQGIPVSPREVSVGIPADLLRRRPDIRSAEYQAVAQSAQIGVAKADLYPALSLVGNFGFSASTIGESSLGDIFRWSSRTYQIGPSLQWNIFNYGQIRNNVRLQDARLQELLLVYQNTVLKAQQDVEDNLAAFLRAQEQAAFLAQSAEAAKNSMNLAVKQYVAGVRDFTAVLIAQQSLLNEQDRLAATLGNISINLVGVYRALGGGWEFREGKELVAPAVTVEMEKRTDWGSLLAPASYNPAAGKKPESSPTSPDW